jgi:peroxiredoxin
MASKKSARRTTKTTTGPKASSAKASSPRGATKSRGVTARAVTARAVSPHLLPPGRKAPDFTLRSTPDKSVTLSEFRGRPVILAFYPADWSPTCGDQLALYNEVLPEFERHYAQLIGISVDGVWCHAAYAKSRNLRFPLLADFEPKGAVAKTYGTYMPSAGWSGRALFVLDGTGTIRWSYLSPIGVNPGADGILTALESLGAAGRAAAGRAAARPART